MVAELKFFLASYLHHALSGKNYVILVLNCLVIVLISF